MAYSPWGRKELNTVERQHFSSVRNTNVQMIRRMLSQTWNLKYCCSQRYIPILSVAIFGDRGFEDGIKVRFPGEVILDSEWLSPDELPLEEKSEEG